MAPAQHACTEAAEACKKCVCVCVCGGGGGSAEVQSIDQSAQSVENFFTFALQLAGLALVAPI